MDLVAEYSPIYKSVSPDLLNKLDDGSRAVHNMYADAAQYSAQEYLAIALNEALEAVGNGNNGVGAVLVARHAGLEFIFSDHNRTRSTSTTHAHAEELVIDGFERFLQSGKRAGLLMIRKAPDDNDYMILASTLEPCQGCARRVLSLKRQKAVISESDSLSLSEGEQYGTDELIIGSPDTEGGGLLEGRPSSATVFKNRLSAIKIVTPQYVDQKSSAHGDVMIKYKWLLDFVTSPEVRSTKVLRPSGFHMDWFEDHAHEILKGKADYVRPGSIFEHLQKP